MDGRKRLGSRGGFGGASPSTDATAESPGQWIVNPAASGTDDNGGGGSEGDPMDSNGAVYGGGRRDDKSKEFIFVNPRNVNIPTFTGKALNTHPYLHFDNAIRRFTMKQGADGDTLFTILNHVEKMGPNTFTNDMLKEIIVIKYLKAPESDRAIRPALYNLINGIAKGLVQHNVANGLDAWRKLYHRYMPLASDLQDILIRELYDLKPVSEADIDNLFDEVARIRDLYLKARPGGRFVRQVG